MAMLIDGASRFGIYWQKFFPISRWSGRGAIMALTWNWNEFMRSLIYLSSQELFTIQLGLRQFQGDIFQDMAAIMSMSVVALVPLLIVFFFAQRHFVQGVVMSGIKG